MTIAVGKQLGTFEITGTLGNGIVHRDLKPANFMLTAAGKFTAGETRLRWMEVVIGGSMAGQWACGSWAVTAPNT